jgi:hypothetical protein
MAAPSGLTRFLPARTVRTYSRISGGAFRRRPWYAPEHWRWPGWGHQPTLTNALGPLWLWVIGVLDEDAAELLTQEREKVSPTLASFLIDLVYLVHGGSPQLPGP